MKRSYKKLFIHQNKGFTLIELIIAIALFGFISAILMSSLISVYQFKIVINSKKQLNFEASSVLNNGLPSMIRSGFAINYNLTQANVRQEFSGGLQEEVDQISIFTDRAESEYFTIYRKPYQDQDNTLSGGGIYISFNDGQEFPLHSSQIVVEDFDVSVPEDPRINGDSDVQPYVTLYLRFRESFLQELPSESKEVIRASYSTTLTLRNARPGNYKTILAS